MQDPSTRESYHAQQREATLARFCGRLDNEPHKHRPGRPLRPILLSTVSPMAIGRAQTVGDRPGRPTIGRMHITDELVCVMPGQSPRPHVDPWADQIVQDEV